MPDPIRKPVMAVTASVQPELAQIVCARSDFPHPFQFHFFQRRHGSYCAKPTGVAIWMAWSEFGQTHLVWKRAGVRESSGPVSGRTPPARYQFSTCRLRSVLPHTSQIILCKISPDPIWFWLILSGFGQTDPVWKQANVQELSACFWPTLPSQSGPDANRIWHVYWE